MDLITLKMIFLLITVFSFFSTYLKYHYYSRGYGWSYSRMSTFNPMYGLVDPRKTNKVQKNFLFLETLYNFLLNILFISFWWTGGLDKLLT